MAASKRANYEIHGMSTSPEHSAWAALKTRCTNPNCPQYARYGKRGIRVCERWALSFGSFLEDVGMRPHPSLSIDRIDNDGHYSCGRCEECLRNGWTANVKWSTRREQIRNSTVARYLEHDGRRLTIDEWASIIGIKPITLSKRLHYGWSVHKALTTPVTPRHE